MLESPDVEPQRSQPIKAPALIALALPVRLAGCASGPSAEEQAAMAADAGKACAALMRKLGAELKAALAQSGPEAAIGVCKTRAPQMTAEVSKAFGFEVKRVSPKNRTLAAVPDASEAGAHAGLEKRLAPEYPLDKATGYGLSMVRGIVSVKRQL